MKKLLQLSFMLVATFGFSQTILQRFNFENNLQNAPNSYTMTNSSGMTPEYVDSYKNTGNIIGTNPISGQPILEYEKALSFNNVNQFGSGVGGNYRINSGGIPNLPPGDAAKAFSFWLQVPNTPVTNTTDIFTFASTSTGTAPVLNPAGTAIAIPATSEGFIFRRMGAINNSNSTHSRFEVLGYGTVLIAVELPNTDVDGWHLWTISFNRYPTNPQNVDGYFQLFRNGVSMGSGPDTNFDSKTFNTSRIGQTALTSPIAVVNFKIDDLRIWNGMSVSQADIIYKDAIKVNAPTAQTVCTGSRISDLDATVLTGATVQWFLTSGAGAPANTLLTNNTDYDVAQTYNGILSAKVRVRVTISAPPGLPIISGTIEPCVPTPPYVGSQLPGTASGNTLRWFATETTPTQITSGTSLAATNSLWVSQVVNGCESARKFCQVNFNTQPTPTGPANQTLPPGDLRDIVVTPTNVVWYTTLANANNNTGSISNMTIIPAGTTTYYARSMANNCYSAGVFTVTVARVTLSAEDFTGNLKFKMYPNPANSILNIDLATELKSVEIYSLQGQKVLSSISKQINISNMSTGIYMVRVTAIDGGVATQKLVKE